MGRPNIVLILNDDMGYSDIGCYGGEVRTPNLDRLAERGLRLTQFYNTARCSPSRASLLTGLHPHQTGIGVLVENLLPEGYAGNLNRRCATIAEVLRPAGYNTYMSGKWHIAGDWFNDKSNWPCQRGFDRFYGTLAGAGSYYNPNTLTRQNDNIEHEAQAADFYYTDAISDNAAAFVADHARAGGEAPFFMYVAYTAPHWPLHAPAEDVQGYAGRFDEGWDALRQRRRQRMIEMGLIDPSWELTERDPAVPPWDAAPDKAWETRRMEVYAAQIDRMDQGIGRVLKSLEETGQLDNTLIIFLADNGACAELIQGDYDWATPGHIGRAKTRDARPVKWGNMTDVMPGPEDTYASYGVGWANLSDTPFRKYKHWAHEGGIATPFIVHWPAGLDGAGAVRHSPAQLPDVMATVLDVSGAEYPARLGEHEILPCEGVSLMRILKTDAPRGKPIFVEHEGNGAMRDGRWKLVRTWPDAWELYDMQTDRTEMHNLAAEQGDRVREMAAAWQAWADRCGVIDREKILEIFKKKH
ncbi:MAG: arylsulfatase [Planctomycetaceae bacterium]|nr:arylsulfatase [Planctomycetaceae bacterium]